MLAPLLVVGELKAADRPIRLLPHHEIQVVAEEPAPARFAGDLAHIVQFPELRSLLRCVARWHDEEIA